MFTYFFSGDGRGRFNSTTHRVNEGRPQAVLMGESAENIGVNISNGLLNIQATDLHFAAPGLDNSLKRVYRGKDSVWKIGAVPFVSLTGSSLSYVHEDGYTSTFTYTYDEINKKYVYVCIWPEVGRVTIEDKNDQWHLTLPAFGRTEIFSKQGLLEKRTSWDGGDLSYGYDAQYRLETVTDSAQKTLLLEYKEQSIVVSYHGVKQAEYIFDAYQRLIEYQRFLEDGNTYNVKFAYAGTTHQLTQIRQSDGTVLDIAYDNSLVKSIGTPTAPQSLEYENNVTTITSPDGTSTKWHYDAASKRLITHETLDRNHLNHLLTYVTQYGYDPRFGFITSQEETDGTRTDIQYDANGLRYQQTLMPADSETPLQIQEWKHNEVGLPITATLKVGEQTSIAHNIYAKNPAQQLRFTISPTGQVKEYRYNDRNQRETQYTYFATYTGKATLEDLETWAANIPESQILKESLEYHPVNGRLVHHELHNIDGKNRPWDYDVDDRGLITRTQEPPKPDGKRPTSTTEYDNIERVTSTTNAENGTTISIYDAATETTPYRQIKTLPTKATEELKLTTSGKINQQIISGQDIETTRINDFTFNNNDQVVTQTDQLGRVTTTLYDDLGRGFGVVDAEGYVTYTHQDHRGRPICVEKILSPLDSARATWDAQEWQTQLNKLREDSDKNRSWILYDALDRPVFKIDATGLVTEYQYGLTNNAEHTIRYFNRITVENLPVNPTIETIRKLVQEHKHPEDIHQRDWYDNDRHIAQLIQKNAIEAYLTEWTYHNQGEIIVQQDYEKAINSPDKWDESLDELRIDAAGEYVLTTRYYNHKYELVGIINDLGEGKGILHEKVRDARGDDVEDIHYFNTVAHSLKPLALGTIRPAEHEEDWHTLRAFDGLHRVTQIIHPNDRREEFRYQDSSTPIEHIEYDERLSDETRPEHARGSDKLVNQLEEPLAELLPDGVDYRSQDPDDTTVWQVYGREIKRDEAGRKAKQKVRLYTEPTRTETHQTIDYYDNRNNVRFHIGAVGERTENIYDAKNNLISTRIYAKKLTQTELDTLLGGRLTPEVTIVLTSNQTADDRVTSYEYDAADRKIVETAPNGQRILYAYTLFPDPSAVAEEFEKDHWRVTFIKHNSQGHVVEQKQAIVSGTREAVFVYLNTQEESVVSVESKRQLLTRETNRFGKPENEKDGNGVEIVNLYDKRQRLIKKTCQTKELQSLEYDAHDRVEIEKDSEPGSKVMKYETTKRKITTIYKEENVELPYVTEITRDAFNQTIVEKHDQNITLTDHNATGGILSETSAIGEKTQHKYAVSGIRIKSIDSAGHVEESLIDAAYRSTGNHYQAPEGAEYDQRTITNTLTTFGETAEKVTEISQSTTNLYAITRKVIRVEHDLRGKTIALTEDPDDLARLTLTPRRLDSELTSQSIGHASKRTDPVREVALEKDGYGRDKKTLTKADENLQLVTEQSYDSGNKPITIKDANGDETHIIYAGHGLSTFTVSPDGFGKLIEVDQKGNQLRQRRFAHRFTPEEVAAIREAAYKNDLASIVLQEKYTSHEDLLDQNIYDRAGYLRYVITPRGQVTEYRYNKAGHKVWGCTYINRVPVDKQPYSISSIAGIIKETPEQDAIFYYITDAEGRALFTIDPERYLTGQTFNEFGLVEESIRYAERIDESENLSTLTLERAQQLAAQREGNKNNKVELDFYSAHTNDKGEHLLRFEINSVGQITQFEHDVFDNVIKTTEYDAIEDMAVLRSMSYADLFAWCKIHDADEGNIVDETRYNALNQKTTEVDANGRVDVYENDLLGNVQKHRDREGHEWIREHDRAGRQTAQYQPLRAVAQITFSPADETFSITRQKKSVKTQYERDGIGRAKKTIEGKGLLDERTHSSLFVPGSKKQKETTLHDVAIYHPELDLTPEAGASRTTFEVKENLIEKKVYDAFEREVVIIYRDGSRAYKIYDADDNEIFRIATDGAVEEYEFDGLEREVAHTEYFNKLQVKALYPNGITESEMRLLMSGMEHPKDRRTTSTYDRLNRRITETLPKAIYVYPTATDNNQKFYNFSVQTLYTYGAFTEPLTETKIINPYKSRQPVKHFYYSDNDPKQVRATINVLGYLTEFFYDGQGWCVREIVYANPSVKFNQTEYEKPKLSPKDEYKEREYDKNGNCLAVWELNFNYHEQVRQSLDTPPTIVEKVAHRVTRTFFDKKALPVVTVRYMVDPQSKKNLLKICDVSITLHSPISNKDKPVTTVQLGPALKRIRRDGTEYYDIPVVAYAHDSHGRVVAQLDFANSLDPVAYLEFQLLLEDILTSDPSSEANRQKIIDEAYKLGAEEKLSQLRDRANDRVAYTQYDAADNPITVQNPQGLTQHLSYTAVPQQVAKDTQWILGWDNLTDRNHTPIMVAKPRVERKDYDRAGHKTKTERWQEHGNEHFVEREQHNTFGEITARGDDNGYQEGWQYDNVGNLVATNEKDGIWKRLFYQPQSKEPSLTITSPTADLSAPAYADPRRLMNLKKAERRESLIVHDDLGRPVEYRHPIYSISKAAPNVVLRSGKQTDQAMIDTFGDYAITWPWPANYGTRVRFWLRVYGTEEWKEQEVIYNTAKTYQGVKTWSLKDNAGLCTDDYEYKIELFHGDDFTKAPYASGKNRIPIVTPNMADSQHAVCYIDPEVSSTRIYIAGKTTVPDMEDTTEAMTGVRIFPPNSDEPIYLGVTPDESFPGRFYAEANGVPRDQYRPGIAKIDRPIGEAYTPQDPNKLKFTSDPKTYADKVFLTEVTTVTHIEETLEVFIATKTLGPDTIPPELPETPITKPTDIDLRYYVHKAVITLTVTGLPVYPEGFVEVKLRVLLASGETREMKGQAHSTEDGATIVTLVYPVDIFKQDPDLLPWENGYPVDQDGKPIEKLPDYPKEILDVFLQGHTLGPDVHTNDGFPLYQKAPNAQNASKVRLEKSKGKADKVTVIKPKTKIATKNNSDFPQRTLFVPQTILKTEDGNTPIAARVTTKRDDSSELVFGTLALSKIDHNSGYFSANLSAYSRDHIDPERLSIQPVGADPLPHPQLPPEPKPDYWVDTGDYASIGGPVVVYNPDPNRIKEDYISDVYVNYAFNNSYGLLFVLFRNYHMLPTAIKNALVNRQGLVKVYGHWQNSPTAPEVELTFSYYLMKPSGEIAHYYPSWNIFIPHRIDISVEINTVKYLVYTGKGEVHDFNSPDLPDQSFPHHSTYAFIPTSPNDVQTQYVEAYRKSDSTLISTSEMKQPFSDGYPHFRVEFPVEVQPLDTYFVPVGREHPINPIVDSYIANVGVNYHAEYSFHSGGGDIWFREDYYVYIYNLASLEPSIVDALRYGLGNVYVKGMRNGLYTVLHMRNRTELSTPDVITFYEQPYDAIYGKYPNPSVYIQIDEIEITVNDPGRGITRLLYKGEKEKENAGDRNFYKDYFGRHVDIYNEHHGIYAFRTARSREQVVSVQAIDKETAIVKATLPILYPYGPSFTHEYIEIPANLDPYNCIFQPVGPALNQNYPVQDHPIDILSYNTQNLHIAEGFWNVNAWVHRAMKWTEVDQNWWDEMWEGEKYMWLDKGDNQIQVHYTRTDDLTGVSTYVTLDYILESRTDSKKSDVITFPVGSSNNYHLLEVYSVETSNVNTETKLIDISSVKIECEIDGQRITVYNNDPKSYPRQQLVYITPLPKEVASMKFEYRSSDSGVNGLWMTLKPRLSSTGEAINVFDSSNLIPGWYDARVKALDSSGKVVDINSITQNGMGADGWYHTKFQVTRQLGSSVPAPDLEQDVITPVETKVWDRHNVVQRTDVRGAIFNYTHNRDRQLVKEVGPPIEILEDEGHLTTPPPSSSKELAVHQGYTPFPITLRGKVQPQFFVELTTPSIADRRHDPRVKIKLAGLKNLPFEQYHITVTFMSKGKPYVFNYTWVPQETKGTLTSKYRSIAHEDGYEETRQFALQSENDLSQNFFLPEGNPTWTLKACHKGVWHTLVEEQPASTYRHQSGTEVTEQSSPSQNTIVVFDINGFHKAEKLRYRDQQGALSEVPVAIPRKAKGKKRLYIAQLPSEITQQEMQFEALVPSQTVRAVPEHLIKTENPVQYHYFDSIGQHLGDRDANGHYWARIVDGKDNPIIEYSPLARKRLTELNVFSEPTATVDASGNVIVKIVDKGGNPIEIRYMNGESERYFYNQYSEELAFIDGRGNQKTTQPGFYGSIAERDADGVWKETKRHRTGEATKETFPDGSSTETQRDFLGRDLGGKDRGRAEIIKIYDLAGGLLVETSSGGERNGNKHVSYSYYPNGFRYQAYDKTHDALLEWTPEIGGEVYRREFISNQANGQLQFMLTERNALGWPTLQSDMDFALRTYYDRVGNKRTLLIEAEGLGADDQVYTFDAEGRAITARATRDLSTGALLWNRDTHNTSVAKYDRDFMRELRTYNRDKDRYMHEIYLYDVRRRPERVLEPDGDDYKEIARWEFDASGNLTFETQRDEGITRYGSYTAANRTVNVFHRDKDGNTSDTTQHWAVDGTLASAEQISSNEDSRVEATLTPSYVHYDADKHEHQVVLKGEVIPHDSDDKEHPIDGVSTLTRNANGALVRFEDEAEPNNDKTTYPDMFGTLYMRAGKEHFRAFPDESGAHVAEYDSENGGWRFGTALLSSTEVSPLSATQTRTAAPGTSLASIAQGSQEWLDALRQANPQYNVNEDIGGKSVKVPYGQARHEMNVTGRGMMPESDRVVGSTLPTAHPPEIKTPEPVGKLREAVSTVANIVVTIAAYKVLGPAATTFLSSAFAGAAAAGAGAAVAGAASAALGSVTGQAISSQGFSLRSVGEAAALGGAMGATQVGIASLGVTEKSIGSVAKAMETAGTSYLVNYATQSMYGKGSFDLRGLAGAMTGAAVSQSLLERSGFVTEGDTRHLTWQEQATNDLMTVFEGFVEAGLAAAFSQEDINMQQWIAQSMGILIGSQAGYGLQKLKEPSTTEASGSSWMDAAKAQSARSPFMTTADYMLQTQDELLFGHKNAHRLVAPHQMAEQKSVNEAVVENASRTLSPRKQKGMLHQYNTQVAQAQHQKGDPRAQAKKAKDTHVDVEAKSAGEAADAQAHSMQTELPIYDYPKRPGWMITLDDMETRLGIPSSQQTLSYTAQDKSSIGVIEFDEQTNSWKLVGYSMTGVEGVLNEMNAYRQSAMSSLPVGTGAPATSSSGFYRAGAKSALSSSWIYSDTAGKWAGAGAKVGAVGSVLSLGEAVYHYNNDDVFEGNAAMVSFATGLAAGEVALVFTNALPLPPGPKHIVNAVGYIGATIYGSIYADDTYRAMYPQANLGVGNYAANIPIYDQSYIAPMPILPPPPVIVKFKGSGVN